MTTTRRLEVWLWAAASVVALVAPAAAEPAPAAPAASAAGKAEARDRFDRGVRLFEKGDNAGALAEFKRAGELVPNPLVLYNMGLVYAAMNRPVAAVEALDAFLAQAGNAHPAQRSNAEKVRREHARRIARLLVKTDAPAVVEVDGMPAGRTPMAEPQQVSSGTHVVQVQAPGFMPARKEVTLAGEVTETLTFTLVPVESRMAQLVISSVPGGAEVTVNGTVVGTTPLPASVAVPAGTAHVEVRRAGYLPAARTVAVGEGARGELAFSLFEDPSAPGAGKGILRVAASEPEVEVRVDGIARQAAAAGIVLPEGPHQVEVVRAGFEPYQQAVTVAAGRETPLALSLVPTPETRLRYEQSVRTRRIAGWTVLGVGAAGLLAGGIYGIAKNGDVDDARKHLDDVLAGEKQSYNPCWAQSPDYQARGCAAIKSDAQNRVDNAVLWRNLGFAGAGVGLLAAGVGTYLLLTAGDPDRYRKPPALTLSGGTLWSDGTHTGLALVGRF